MPTAAGAGPGLEPGAGKPTQDSNVSGESRATKAITMISDDLHQQKLQSKGSDCHQTHTLM